MASQTIADLALGSKIYLYENGEPVEYFVAEHGTLETTIVRGQAYGTAPRSMNSTAMNPAVYNGCDMDLWLSDISNGFLSIFDTATRSAFTAKSIKVFDVSQNSVIELARTAFLLSQTEVGGSYSSDEGPSMMMAFELYTGQTGNNARTINVERWWLRSPSRSSNQNFCTVRNGSISSSISSSVATDGTYQYPRPAISVSNTTSVSDDTEETIYLLPDQNKKYTSVDGIIITGATSSRPSKARLIVPTNNLYDIELAVSNNAGDANPVWISCTNGGTCTLTHTTKETTNWMLGVKMYGKSGGRGYFGEPVLLVEEDAT